MLIQDHFTVFSMVVYKIWWTYVGTLSDFATLLRHSTTERLQTPVLDRPTAEGKTLSETEPRFLGYRTAVTTPTELSQPQTLS
jgi:hypothetical protein